MCSEKYYFNKLQFKGFDFIIIIMHPHCHREKTTTNICATRMLCMALNLCIYSLKNFIVKYTSVGSTPIGSFKDDEFLLKLRLSN